MNTHLTYETVPVQALKAYPRNPRHHSKQQIRRIAESIREFGFTNPVLIDENGELIAGHGRMAAAALLELPEVPTIRVRGLNTAQKRALRISDNALGLRSSWSMDVLSEELKGLIDLDFEIELTGFDAIEIDRIVTTDAEPPEEEAPLAPPPQISVSRPGDLWELGKSHVLCGNALERGSYERLLDGRLADMVIQDFPYNVPIQGHVSGTKRHGEFAMASGEMNRDEFREFLRRSISHTRDFSRDGSLHYGFMDWRSIAVLIEVGCELFAEHKNVICWFKSNGAGMGSLYRSQHELIAVFKHGRAPHVNNVQLGRMGRYRSNVWQYPGAAGFSKARTKDLQDHCTVKPIRLVADAIRDATNPGDLVLDAFGGSGTTLLAAEQIGRRAALIEIEPRYVDVTLRRFHEQSGTEPVLLPERVPLNAMRAQRLAGDH